MRFAKLYPTYEMFKKELKLYGTINIDETLYNVIRAYYSHYEYRWDSEDICSAKTAMLMETVILSWDTWKTLKSYDITKMTTSQVLDTFTTYRLDNTEDKDTYKQYGERMITNERGKILDPNKEFKKLLTQYQNIVDKNINSLTKLFVPYYPNKGDIWN